MKSTLKAGAPAGILKKWLFDWARSTDDVVDTEKLLARLKPSLTITVLSVWNSMPGELGSSRFMTAVCSPTVAAVTITGNCTGTLRGRLTVGADENEPTLPTQLTL